MHINRVVRIAMNNAGHTQMVLDAANPGVIRTTPPELLALLH